ncbi:hypothetical protein E4U53_005670 [Claviceps sorghi]|nr:hypothetical protein E4U53_005670 [Claviceps sorghi]
MAAAVSARRTMSPSGVGEADIEDSNISSPLSEVDDGDANEDDIQHMQIDHQNDGPDMSGASENEAANDDANNHDRSDSESALSEAGIDENSEANDTEAETERLYDTPKNQRQRVVVFDQYSNGRIFEHTPSKLRSTTGLIGDEEPNAGDDVSASDEDVSAASADDSPTKPTASNDTSIDGEGKGDSLERKRKRSPLGDQSELDEPLRKRLTSVGATEPDLVADSLTKVEYTISENPPDCRAPSAGEDNDAPAAVTQGGVAGSQLPDKEKNVSKKLTRNGSKRKAAESGNTSSSDTPRQDLIGETIDTPDDEEPEQRHEDMELYADEHDAVAKSIEEAERKNAAFRDWSHIEEMFGIFRDRLYKDRLQRLEEEERSLLADVPTHPEFLNMKQCLDDRLQKRVQEVNAECALRLEAHERRAVAMRAQVWSQFFQAVRERREAALESLNRQWYEVQTARRSAHSLPDFGLLFPKDQGRRVRNAIAYNTEVSTLAGLAKYEGFPAGPELKGASPSEVDADFSAIEKVRRSRQKTIVPARDDYPAPAFARLGPAGEQFIKDTPWANPHHSSHKLYPQLHHHHPHHPHQNQHQPHHQPHHQSQHQPQHQPQHPQQQQRQQQYQQHISNVVTHVGRPNPVGAGPVATQPPVNVRPTFDSQMPIVKSIGAMACVSGPTDLSRQILSPTAQQLKTLSSAPNTGKGSKTAAQ